MRTIVEVYASRDGGRKFAADFVVAWVKVVNLDLPVARYPAHA